MILYYHSWVFYNHFIVTLYHFLRLTYWHSAQCQLQFLLVFDFAKYQYQTKSKCHETFWRFFSGNKSPWKVREGTRRWSGGPWGTMAHPGGGARPGGLWGPCGSGDPNLSTINSYFLIKNRRRSFITFYDVEPPQPDVYYTTYSCRLVLGLQA